MVAVTTSVKSVTVGVLIIGAVSVLLVSVCAPPTLAIVAAASPSSVKIRSAPSVAGGLIRAVK